MASVPDSDDEHFHDARETLTSSAMSSSLFPVLLPVHYDHIESLPSPIPPPDSELSFFKLVREVLSSVKPGSDITNIVLPASILDPVSTLEKTKKSMQRGELLQDICASSDPVSRMLNVIRFNLSGLAKERFGKKPYNPVLGEVYRCCFPHRGAGGETLLIAEQVSHHPPVTALHLRNDTLGFRMNSFTAPEPRFWGNTLEVKLRGEIRIVLTNFDNEEYVITRPLINMAGLLAGKQRLEFNGLSSFACERSGLGAKIEFKVRGPMALRTDLHSITGRIFTLADDETLFTLDGNWDKKVTLTEVKTGRQSTLFDYEAVAFEKSMIAVLPSENEEEKSFSTRVWADCSSAIKSGDTVAANLEKRKVEDYQRLLKRERVANGVEWKWQYFRKQEGGKEGYDLRGDLGNDSLVKLRLSAEEIKGLRSGELVKEMQAEMEQETEHGETKRHTGTRLGRLARRRARV